MRPVRLTVTGVGVSAPVPMNWVQDPFAVGIGCTATGTVTYTVQHTYDDVYAVTFDPTTAKWYPHPTIAAQSASLDGSYAFPVSAVRLNVTAGTGSVVFNVIQAGI